MAEEKTKKKRKRSTKIIKEGAMFHPYPVVNPFAVLEGDILETSVGEFVRVTRKCKDEMVLETDDLFSVKGKDGEDVVNACLDIYNDSTKHQKFAVEQLIMYLEPVFEY